MSTRRYGVVGMPVRQSLSPWLHGHFARRLQRQILYAAYSPAPGEFDSFVREFFGATGGSGLNITAPYKQNALAAADNASAFSRRAGAANVLLIRNGGIFACNTDGAGLIRDLRQNLGVSVNERRVLLVGAGGAARAAALALAEAGAKLVIGARRKPAAEELALLAGCEFASLEECGGGYEVVINATSGGHEGAAPELSPEVFSDAVLAYDLNYGKAAAPFLRLASAVELRADGAGMLAEQAALSFALWERAMPSAAGLSSFLRERHRAFWE